MSRSSATFWKVARQNVDDLPGCPPYLSEPAYANLLYFPYCHVRMQYFMHESIDILLIWHRDA